MENAKVAIDLRRKYLLLCGTDGLYTRAGMETHRNFLKILLLKGKNAATKLRAALPKIR
jgi:hypothetical protein